MLVLSRRVGEEIVIDGDIRISVLEIAKGTIRLGIVAPPLIRIDRQEIHERRAKAAARAARQTAAGFGATRESEGVTEEAEAAQAEV